jgi:antirestriction protein ArdC
MNNQEVYKRLTERIVAMLESGTVPWRKGWVSFLPMSLATGKPYRGVNVFLTASQGYGNPYWGTANQINSFCAECGTKMKENGRTKRGRPKFSCPKCGGWKGHLIRKGEKSTPVVVWRPVERTKTDDTGQKVTETFWLFRMYSVFNLEQTTMADAGHGPQVPKINETFSPIDKAEAIIEDMADRPAIEEGRAPAYSVKRDAVMLPRKSYFPKEIDYYSAAFHELAHATGHPSRLGRFKGEIDENIFGSDSYSQEELVAEFTATFLASEAGIEGQILENSVAYIQHWIEKLKSNPTMAYKAARDAQKAADFILGTEGADGTENASDGDSELPAASVDAADQTTPAPAA